MEFKEFKTRDNTSRRQHRNNNTYRPYPQTHHNGTHRNTSTYQSSSYNGSNTRNNNGSSTSSYYQQHQNKYKVPKNSRSLPSKEPSPQPQKINEEEVQKNATLYRKFELSIKERIDSFKEKKKNGPIICHRDRKEITDNLNVPFDEWSSFVAAVPKMQSPPRQREKHNNNRFAPYNKTSSLSQHKQNHAVSDNNGGNNGGNQEPKINDAMGFVVYLGLGNSNLLNQQEMKIAEENTRKEEAIKQARESLKNFREKRKGKMSPENEVAYRSQEFKKAPEIATKRPVQTSSTSKISDATTRDGTKIKSEPQTMKLIVKLSYNKADRKSRENHIKDMRRQQNLSSSSSSSSSFSSTSTTNPPHSSAVSSTTDLTASSISTAATTITTTTTTVTKKIKDESPEIKNIEIKREPPQTLNTLIQTDDCKVETRSIQIQTDNPDSVQIDPQEVRFHQAIAERKFNLAKAYKRRADHSRTEKELSEMSEKQKLERLSDHMEILILYTEWFYRNIQAHGENTIDKIGFVLNSIDNHFCWVSDNAKKHDPNALLLPLINKLRAIFLMNRLGLEQKRFNRLSNEYISSFNEEAANGVFSSSTTSKYINVLNEMQKSAASLFKLITNLWDEDKNFRVSDKVNNGVNPLKLTIPIEKASEFAKSFVNDWRDINNIVFVSLTNLS